VYLTLVSLELGFLSVGEKGAVVLGFEGVGGLVVRGVGFAGGAVFASFSSSYSFSFIR
jgi:hypothetical protein